MIPGPGWRWKRLPVLAGCTACPHLKNEQGITGDWESWCAHPRRGSSTSLPELCEPDVTDFEPDNDPESRYEWVPSWCGYLPEPDTPCTSCGDKAPKRDDLCDSCGEYYANLPEDFRGTP